MMADEKIVHSTDEQISMAATAIDEAFMAFIQANGGHLHDSEIFAGALLNSYARVVVSIEADRIMGGDATVHQAQAVMLHKALFFLGVQAPVKIGIPSSVFTEMGHKIMPELLRDFRQGLGK